LNYDRDEMTKEHVSLMRDIISTVHL